MVNIIKDIINKLDGYSSDNQGFAVTSFATVKVNGGIGGIGVKLHVKPYLKNEEIEGLPDEEHLTEMVSRLLSRYSDAPRYAVYKAEMVWGVWELTVQLIQEKAEEEAEEEDKIDEV